MAFALVALTCRSWDWSRGVPLPLFPFSAGLGVWAFVRAFCLVFAKKMEEANRVRASN
jgi:hypothetical protein